MATLLNGSRYSGFYDYQSFLKKKNRTSWPNKCSFQRLSKGGNLFTKKGINVLSPEITVPSFAPEFLDAVEDEYNGGKEGVWLKILPEQEGFSYHHAEPRYLMLTHWIPNEPCMLPGSPSHQIGIGGFSEEIFSAAIREVKEETGVRKLLLYITSPFLCRLWLPSPFNLQVDTIFQQMVAFRYSTFENSDILFMCMLEPLSSEITIDDKEIQDAKWMPLNEFVGQQFYVDDQMTRKVIDVCVKAYEDGYDGFVARHLTSKLDGICHAYTTVINLEN
ncbi:hypothetical protein Ddye_020696 [Dipteronia dyeriana]|uniref:Nudix hydrolase domain-containing protein n=1 Tax=Dipteronia dyeriana TaxID=168575 RepID=A0AAD9U108_9ROSI|nr:hypothetical protein Ddye_020696 [Dipteronia dyeriana]